MCSVDPLHDQVWTIGFTGTIMFEADGAVNEMPNIDSVSIARMFHAFTRKTAPNQCYLCVIVVFSKYIRRGHKRTACRQFDTYRWINCRFDGAVVLLGCTGQDLSLIHI